MYETSYICNKWITVNFYSKFPEPQAQLLRQKVHTDEGLALAPLENQSNCLSCSIYDIYCSSGLYTIEHFKFQEVFISNV